MEEKSPSATYPVREPADAVSPGDTSRAFPRGPAGPTEEADLQGKVSMFLAEMPVGVWCPKMTMNPFPKWVLLSKCLVIYNVGNIGDDSLTLLNVGVVWFS